MRTRIKVTDLTLRQWDHLQDVLPAEHDIPEGAVRMCVEFEIDLPGQIRGRHVEMPVRTFVRMMTQLQRIERYEPDALMVATAALTPDALPDHLEAVRNAAERVTCDHSSPVVRETPSAFEGADPVRDFEDGCSGVGPYRSPEDSGDVLDGYTGRPY